MENIKQYFHGNDIDTKAVADMMMQKPWEAKEFLDKVIHYAGFLMKKEALEHKFKHKMRELYEEYDLVDEK